MHPALVRSIFDSYHSKFAKETAKTFEISVYLANYAWQRWCRALEALPVAHRHEVYAVCQMSWKTALTKFRHTASELRWLCRHWRQSLRAQAVRAGLSAGLLTVRRANALRIFALYAPARSITGSVYDDACLYIKMAVTAARERRYGRCHGELTSRELAREQRSDFAWVFKTLQSMGHDHIVECFGRFGIDFPQSMLVDIRAPTAASTGAPEGSRSRYAAGEQGFKRRLQGDTLLLSAAATSLPNRDRGTRCRACKRLGKPLQSSKMERLRAQWTIMIAAWVALRHPATSYAEDDGVVPCPVASR